MMISAFRARWVDASAIALSALCMVHCLALPVFAALLPMLGAWTHDHRVHVLFLLLAVPLTAFALWRAHRRSPLPRSIRVMAALGLLALAAGALGWAGEDGETPVTVAGSLLLIATPLWNVWRHPRRCPASGTTRRVA